MDAKDKLRFVVYSISVPLFVIACLCLIAYSGHTLTDYATDDAHEVSASDFVKRWCNEPDRFFQYFGSDDRFDYFDERGFLHTCLKVRRGDLDIEPFSFRSRDPRRMIFTPRVSPTATTMKQ